MANFSIRSEEAIRDALQQACNRRELLILVTPYLRIESSFVRLEEREVQVTANMSREDAQFGLKNPELRMRFPAHQRFLEAPTRVVGFGAAGGRPTLRLAIPDHIDEDDHRSAYRVERVGRVPVTFSTRKYELIVGSLVNISVTGARIHSQRDFEEDEVRVDDTLSITIPVAEGIHLNTWAKVRYVQDRNVGLEYRPPLQGELLDRLNRWVFLKREEELERLAFSANAVEAEEVKPLSPQEGILLLSSDAALEGVLQEPLAATAPFRRQAPGFQALKEVLPGSRSLVLFHVPAGDLDTRKRLKLLVEAMPAKVPFMLLGTGLENTALMELGAEHRAVATCGLDPTKPNPFAARLIQGVWRKHFGQHPTP